MRLLLAGLLMLCFGGTAFAEDEKPVVPVTPAEGVYVSEGGYGLMRVRTYGTELRFDLETTGANGHSCGVEGMVDGVGSGVTTEEDAHERCHLQFGAIEGGVSVAAKAGSEEVCRYFCGARASFDFDYMKVTDICDPAKVDILVGSFTYVTTAEEKQLVDGQITPLLAACGKTLRADQVSDIHMAQALSSYRVGDSAGCHAALKEEEELFTMTDEKILEEYGYAPSDAINLVERAKKLRDAAALCSIADKQQPVAKPVKGN